MLKFNSGNVIDGKSATDTVISSADEIVADNLSNPNAMVQLFTMAKLIKLLLPYSTQEKLSYFDQNLFNNFFKKMEKDKEKEDHNHEHQKEHNHD